MLKYFLKRLLDLIPTLVGVTVISFFLVRMVPGDPVMLMLGERGASPERYQEMKKNLGLDRPIHEQYLVFIKNALQGNLGKSIVSKRSVTQEFKGRFGATLELGVVPYSLRQHLVFLLASSLP